jgi:hypothetical protein
MNFFTNRNKNCDCYPFAGRSIVLCGVSNVILHNFQISTVGESDTVHIYAGSSRVWVDHLTSTDAKLGLVSVFQLQFQPVVGGF